ncbi:MAG: membrane protein insertion efficiency factor YidD [Clostridia bacterium]|nr:membrane protein insertion efficiency factor YidD [Clostridia bacterium]
MKKIFTLPIKAYKKFISPVLPKACRFTPTCSEYAIEAIERFGVVRGSMLASYRIMRCNPFSKGGYDPVPEKFTFKRQKNNTGENKE